MGYMDVFVLFCVLYMKNFKYLLMCIEYWIENFSKKNNFILIEYCCEFFDFKFIWNFIIFIYKVWLYCY